MTEVLERLLALGFAIIVRTTSQERRFLTERFVTKGVRRRKYFHDGRWLMEVWWVGWSVLDDWTHHPKLWWISHEFYILPDPDLTGPRAWRDEQ